MARKPRKIPKYSNPVSLFARVLQKHERQIARHTAIQSALATVQIFVGAATTAVLIYIAYQQYRTTDRQVALEYAKVTPAYTITVNRTPDESDDHLETLFPSSLRIRLESGQGRLRSVETLQDIRLAILPTGEQWMCNLRIRNYFEAAGSTTDFNPNEVMSRVFRDPVGFPIWPGDYYSFNPESTWVRLTYIDVFGKKIERLYGGKDTVLGELPGTEIPDSLFGTMEGNIARGTNAVPLKFIPAEKPIDDEDCRRIAAKLKVDT